MEKQKERNGMYSLMKSHKEIVKSLEAHEHYWFIIARMELAKYA